MTVKSIAEVAGVSEARVRQVLRDNLGFQPVLREVEGRTGKTRTYVLDQESSNQVIDYILEHKR